MKRSPETSNSVFYPHSSSDVSVGGRFYMMDAMGQKEILPIASNCFIVVQEKRKIFNDTSFGRPGYILDPLLPRFRVAVAVSGNPYMTNVASYLLILCPHSA